MKYSWVSTIKLKTLERAITGNV